MGSNLEQIRERIAKRRKELGLSYQDLSDRTGMSKSTLQRYETGDIRNVSLDKLEPLANALQTTPSYLMGWEDAPDEPPTSKIKNIEDIIEISTYKIPLLGNIACGVPNYAEEYFEGYVEAGIEVEADFALRCNGDSMINARILDGDIVFIRKQDTVNNGEIAAVLVEEEATLKRVYIEGNIVTLLAENKDYPPRIINLREDSDLVFKILGKAVAFQSDVI